MWLFVGPNPPAAIYVLIIPDSLKGFYDSALQI